MTRSDDINEHGLVLHEEAIRKKEKKQRNRDRPAIKKRPGKPAKQQKIANHLDIISNRIEMQIDAQIGRHVLDRVEYRRREHENRNDRNHEMRDIAGK